MLAADNSPIDTEVTRCDCPCNICGQSLTMHNDHCDQLPCDDDNGQPDVRVVQVRWAVSQICMYGIRDDAIYTRNRWLSMATNWFTGYWCCTGCIAAYAISSNIPAFIYTSVYYVGLLQSQIVATGYANNKIHKEAVKIDIKCNYGYTKQ